MWPSVAPPGLERVFREGVEILGAVDHLDNGVITRGLSLLDLLAHPCLSFLRVLRRHEEGLVDGAFVVTHSVTVHAASESPIDVPGESVADPYRQRMRRPPRGRGRGRCQGAGYPYDGRWWYRSKPIGVRIMASQIRRVSRSISAEVALQAWLDRGT